MKHSGPLRSASRRLILLAGLLALAAVALLAQRAWFSPEAREKRLAAMSLDQLEKRVGESRDPLLFYYLAHARSEVGDTPGAIAAAEQAVQLDPHLTRARVSLGTLLLSANRDAEALQQLNDALKEDPSRVDAYLGLALFYERYEGWDRVATLAESAAKIDPTNLSAWILRGDAAARLGQKQQAAGYYEHAARAAPRAALPRTLAARARLALDDPDTAEKEAREAVRLDPKDPRGLAVLGAVLLRHGGGHLAEAAHFLEQAISLGETSGEAYFELGRAYQRQGRYLDAEQEYRLALRADHTRNDARYGLFQVLGAQGRGAEASTVEREFHQWVHLQEQRDRNHDRAALHREDPRAWFALARVETQMGLWASARRNVESGLRRAPNDDEGLRLRAEIEQGMRNKHERERVDAVLTPGLLVAALALLAPLPGCAWHAAATPAAPPPRPAFANVAPDVGISFRCDLPSRRPRDILEANGSGCAFLDYDGDGRLDLLLAGWPHCALYRNLGSRFVDVAPAAGLGSTGRWIGAAAADFDNDGWTDLCLTGYGTGALYRNQGGRFVNVTREAGIRFPRWGQSAAWGDIDNDGILDLYLSAYARYGPEGPRYCRRRTEPVLCGPELYQPEVGRLYRNLGTSAGRIRFRDVTREAGFLTQHGRSWGAMFQDYDDDGWQDLYIGNDMIAGDLFHNLGRGRYRNVGMASGTAFDAVGRRQAGMSVDWTDYDDDGRPDCVLVTTFSEQGASLYHNEGAGQFSEVSRNAGMARPTFPYVGFGAKFIDYDNDGWRDALLASGHVEDNADRVRVTEHYRQPLLLLRNSGGQFSDVSDSLLRGLPLIVGRGAAFGDFDNDGRPDALVMDLEGPPLLLRNQSPGGHWLGIRLTGTRSNRDGIGARVRVTAGGRRQRLECQTSGSVLSSNDPRLLFGLGAAAAADEVEVRWPSGRITKQRGVPADRYASVREP